MPPTDNSPSHARRQALRQADASNSIRVLDSYPLTKYFDIAQRLLDAFQKAVDKRRLDEAYVYGLRFAAFGVEALPKHKEWRRDKTYAQLKRRNAKQVEKVISMMEIIKQRMDAEELILQEKRRYDDEERERQLQLTIREQEQAAIQQEKLLQESQSMKEMESEQLTTVAQSAMAKLLAMQNMISAPQNEARKAVGSRPSPMKVPPVASSSPRPPRMEQNHPMTKSVSVSPGSNASVRVNVIASSPSPVPSTPSSEATNIPRMTPRSSKEQQTIDMLDATIAAQEKRLEEIENFQIPTFVRLAKGHLQQGEEGRSTALKCVARKRSLEREMDVIKAAIFNMETQKFMLENAMEDRHVQKALDEASNAMKRLQQSIGGSSAAQAIDLNDLTASLPMVMDLDQEETDGELLMELERWMSPGAPTQEGQTSMNEDDISILSMPVIPAVVLSDKKALPVNPSEDEPRGVGTLMRAVLG